MRRFDLDDTDPGAGDPPSLGALFRALSADASTLVRQEVALARVEMQRNVRGLARDAGSLAAWGMVSVAGGLVLVAFLVAGLGDLLDSYWLAALIVGLVFVAVGAGMTLRSLRRLRGAPVRPEETVASLRDTGTWARTEAAELRTAVTGRHEGRNGGAGASSAPRSANRIAGLLPPDEGPLPAPPRSAGRAAGVGEPSRAAGSGEGFAKRVWKGIQEDDVMGQGAKLAYYAFLSLPPALLVIFGLTGFFGGNAAAEWITGRLGAALPGEASALVDQFVQQVVYEQAPGPFSVGLLLALWAASNVFAALADSLNAAYDVEEDRSWIRRRATAVGVMLAFAALLLGGSVAILAGPAIARSIGLWGTAEAIWGVLQWPLAFLLVVGAFWIAYYVLPNRDQRADKWRIFKGAAIAAVLWGLATTAFRLYIANFGSYGETYGFLGAFIILLLWMYMTGVVVLLGGEINSEMK
jgi:membrane protein